VSMRAGRLRERVQLQQRADTRDATGDVVKAWSTVATVRAAIEPLSGREFFQAEQVASNVRVRIVVRYSSDLAAIDSSWRVVDANNGNKYAIESVINRQVRGESLQLMCSEGDKDDE